MPPEKARALKAFAVLVVIAVLMRWEAGDLMWGIWASSITYGLVYGIVLIKFNPEDVDAGDGSDRRRLVVVLGFFIFMIAAFHYALGIFLSMVFPITSLDGFAVFGL